MKTIRKILHFSLNILIFIVFADIIVVFLQQFSVLVFGELILFLGFLFFVGRRTLYYGRDHTFAHYPFKFTGKYYDIGGFFSRDTITIGIRKFAVKTLNKNYFGYDILGAIQKDKAKDVLSAALVEAIYNFYNSSETKSCKKLEISSEMPIYLNDLNYNVINSYQFNSIDLSKLLTEQHSRFNNNPFEYHKFYESFANACYKLTLPKSDVNQYAFIADVFYQKILCYELDIVKNYIETFTNANSNIVYLKLTHPRDKYYSQITEEEYYSIKKTFNKYKE